MKRSDVRGSAGNWIEGPTTGTSYVRIERSGLSDVEKEYDEVESCRRRNTCDNLRGEFVCVCVEELSADSVISSDRRSVAQGE